MHGWNKKPIGFETLFDTVFFGNELWGNILQFVFSCDGSIFRRDFCDRVFFTRNGSILKKERRYVKMKNKDSIKLLRECNSGSKMAISSIRDVLDDIEEEKLKRLLENYIHKHEEYGEELHALLSANEVSAEEPKHSAQMMAKMVTGMKLMANRSSAQIANLMIDGCNMGVKSISKYQNQYKDADRESIEFSEELVKIEQHMANGLRRFLS